MLFTHFWVDNFDVLVDRKVGGGSVHTTHMVAFQVPNGDSQRKVVRPVIERKKNRSLFIEDVNISTSIPVDKKKNPPDTFTSPPASNSNSETSFKIAYLTWLYLRKSNSFLQRVPVFKGWKLQTRSINGPDIIKSSETYLPPINAKVTDYQTIQRYMRYLQTLAEKVNMPFVNVTLDVGAAMNAYLVTWNAPELYDRRLYVSGGKN